MKQICVSLLHDDIGTVESIFSCSNLGVSYILLGLREVDAEVKPDLLCCWTEILSFAFLIVYSSILNQKICLRNDLCIREEGVFCIRNLYSLINFDRQLGDGIGWIIWCDHGVGGILHLTGSDVSILIIYII